MIGLVTHRTLTPTPWGSRWLITWIDAAFRQVPFLSMIWCRWWAACLSRPGLWNVFVHTWHPCVKVAVVPESACLQPPIMIQLSLRGGGSMKLRADSRMTQYRPSPEVSRELFGTNAKAENGAVRTGGRETRYTQNAHEARWFSVELNEANYPWLRCRGKPFRVVAALEI